MGGELLDGVLAVRAGHARGNRLPSAGGEAAVDGSVVDGDLVADLDGRGRRGSAAGLGDVIKGNPADAGFQLPTFGIMDGHFVPNLMLSTDILKAIKQRFTTPLDLHLMIESPEHILDKLIFGKGDIVSIHVESTPHVCRALEIIKGRGAIAAIALNPSTPLAYALELLDYIDLLLLMTVNPGFAAQKMLPFALDKIKRARKMLDEHGHEATPIEVDGNCSFEHIPQMEKAGANIFVTGSSSVFCASLGLEQGLLQTRACLANR